jgi:cellulose synthase/poly-beta-1,6-N-acetylglucosamine synthase-like glycosyltransferase
MTAVSSLAILVRNRVRPLGLHRLGLPCHLTGSGMAFPWRVLRDAPATGANLVEDLVMGIEMALTGHPPLLCPSVRISSDLPTNWTAATSQRRRWEHGQLHTLARYAPRLIAAGVTRRRLSLIALGLDLAVPPLALLTAADGGVLAATLALAALGAITPFPAILAALDVAILTAAVGLAWLKFGRSTIPLRYVFSIPFYVARKVPLYLSLLVRGKQKTWERTAREDKESTDRTLDSKGS